jgi:signal peptidase I
MKKRKPWLAALLSFLCPGLGQLYNGNIRLALTALPVGAVLTLVSSLYLFDSLNKLLVALALGFVFDTIYSVQAYREAKLRGAIQPGRYQSWWAYALFAVVLYGLPDGYGLFLPERFLSFQIPSESMVPNLLIGDRLVADGWAYWKKEPTRGDVIVFKFPRDESIVYVKRLVGLPGDKVELREGVLFINDREITQAKLGPGEKKDGYEMVKYEETLGDKRHVLQRAAFSAFPNFGPSTVPPGEYFMMGDNRDRSSDSRAWGFVRRDQLLGRMNFVYFSWDSAASWLRTDRFGLKVN